MKDFIRIMVLLLPIFAPTTVKARSNKVLKNHIFKTIKAENGDIIDCVDFYKQPAFDHPLLKNHTIKIPQTEASSNTSGFQQAWQKHERCPEETIPILRSRGKRIKPSLFSPELLTMGAKGHQLAPQEDQPTNGVAYGALAYSYFGPYHGAIATLENWNPHVEFLDYSLGAVMVLGTGDSDYHPGEPLPRIRNTAGVGWAVHPQLFGDNTARLFVYWTKDEEGGVQGCFNVQCPGFVQISDYIYPGMVIPTSRYGGEKIGGRYGVFQEVAEEKWYVTIGGERVGYWPNVIFNNFWDCDGILIGGQVFNGEPGGNPSPTQMGSGHFTNEGGERSALVTDAVSIRAGGIINPNHYPSTSVVTNRNCYDYRLLDNHPDGTPGFDFLYGGPGSLSVDCE